MMVQIPMSDTFPKLLKYANDKYGDKKVAMRKKDFGIWQPYTWKDYYEKVKFFSLGIISLGLQRGDKVSILGENDPEWYWADLAIEAAGGITVGIFVDCLPEEVKYYAKDSESRFMLAHDQEQVDKVLGIKDELPLIQKVIYWDPKGLWNYEEPLLMSFDQVLEIGRKYEIDHPQLFEENIERGNADDVALILYTSGTTGLPKGAMISHDNVLSIVRSIVRADNWTKNYNYVSNLPPAWITEHALGVGSSLMTGSSVSFPEEPETVQEDIRDIGPDITMFNPRLWELNARTVKAKINDAGWLKRLCYNMFMPVAYKMADAENQRKKLNLFWKIVYALGNWIIYRPLKDKLGLLRIKHAWTGGGAISPDIIKFFRGIGVNLKDGYGTSESGVCLTGAPGKDVKIGTSGPPREGCELRISEDGELIVRGVGLFKGYYRKPDVTKSKIINGWFHTGDFCHIDEDGELVVIDRMEDLKELSGNRKFSPQYSEIRLRFSPYIKDALVVGSSDVDYVAAIINIDIENVGRWAEKKHIPYTTFTDLSQKPQVIDLVAKEIGNVNKNLPEYAKIKRFVNLHKEFDPDEAELTRTRKLRRLFVESRFRNIIEAIYSNKPEIKIEAPIVYRDGRKGVIETTLKVRILD